MISIPLTEATEIYSRMGIMDFSCFCCSTEGEQNNTFWSEMEAEDTNDVCEYEHQEKEDIICGGDCYLYKYDQNPLIHGFDKIKEIVQDNYSRDGWEFDDHEGYNDVLAEGGMASVWQCGDEWIVNVCQSCHLYFMESTNYSSCAGADEQMEYNPPPELLVKVVQKFKLIPYQAFVPITEEALMSKDVDPIVPMMFPLSRDDLLRYLRAYFEYLGLRKVETLPAQLVNLCSNPTISKIANGEALTPEDDVKSPAYFEGQAYTPLSAALDFGCQEDLEIIFQTPDLIITQNDMELLIDHHFDFCMDELVDYNDLNASKFASHIMGHSEYWHYIQSGKFEDEDFKPYFPRYTDDDPKADQLNHLLIKQFPSLLEEFDFHDIVYRKNMDKLMYCLSLGIKPQFWFWELIDFNWREGVIECQKVGTRPDFKCQAYIAQKRCKLEFGVDGILI